MTTHTTIKQWQEKEFLPWKNAAEQYQNTLLQEEEKIKRYATELKSILAFIMANKPKKAIKLWNSLDLQPALEKIVVVDNDTLTLTTTTGKEFNIMLDDLITDLSALLN